MAIHLHVMDRGRRLDPKARETLLDPIRTAVQEIMAHAPDLDADLSVVPTDILDRRFRCCRGIAYGPGSALIEVNPDHSQYVEDWPRGGTALALHELHHCLRWPYIGREGWTLGEVAVLEGLAILAEEAVGQPITSARDPRTLPALCDRLWAERHKVESDETAWFRASEADGQPTDMPVNYLIGRAMMRKALAELALDPFDAARLPVEDLLAASRRLD
ncbi:MAG: DUF2268 domain-containing putative Zn-dependent protease [Pseudomonadota bacterium]